MSDCRWWEELGAPRACARRKKTHRCQSAIISNNTAIETSQDSQFITCSNTRTKKYIIHTHKRCLTCKNYTLFTWIINRIATVPDVAMTLTEFGMRHINDGRTDSAKWPKSFPSSCAINLLFKNGKPQVAMLKTEILRKWNKNYNIQLIMHRIQRNNSPRVDTRINKNNVLSLKLISVNFHMKIHLRICEIFSCWQILLRDD